MLFDKSKCICLDRKVDSPRLYYSRFAISPLLSGQASILGNSIRKILLGEIQGTSVTCVTFTDIVNEYSNFPGIRESVHDILLNIRDIVLIGNTGKLQKGSIIFKGPGIITAKHIQLPSFVTLVDKTQHIAHVETNTEIKIDLVIEKGRGWQVQKDLSIIGSTFLIDAQFTPVKHVNYSIYSLGEGTVLQELLMLEIWTNGALTPEEALIKACENISMLLEPILSIKKNQFS